VKHNVMCCRNSLSNKCWNWYYKSFSVAHQGTQ